ncbi:MAG: SIR2 family protein, partial [Roseiarcus sp.]
MTAIRSFLDRPDGVIFVGSGISRWAGLPSWQGMIEELAEFLDANGESSALVRHEAAGGDLLQAASYGFSKLTPPGIGEFVRKAVRLGSAKPCEIHKAIVELGPTCYITTNYDDLIEQALREWQPDAFYPAPVTNGHLVEIADILSARSSHFIFKPHGDATDAASIVLTREQYRKLLPDGERHGALEALKTLLVTRPVLYLGFGLRDPDFLYVRDLLLNTFQGATRDHYAIMSDIHDDEPD